MYVVLIIHPLILCRRTRLILCSRSSKDVSKTYSFTEHYLGTSLYRHDTYCTSHNSLISHFSNRVLKYMLSRCYYYVVGCRRLVVSAFHHRCSTSVVFDYPRILHSALFERHYYEYRRCDGNGWTGFEFELI